MRRLAAVITLVLALPAAVQMAAAQTPAPDDPVLEKRVMRLAAELRCLVCQNQSLADSHADLAIDLKNQVREQMKAGRSDDEIRSYMVARYGDFVLYDPPVKASTLLLWVGPFALLVLASAGLALYLRRRGERVTDGELSAAERARADALLGGGGKGETQ